MAPAYLVSAIMNGVMNVPESGHYYLRLDHSIVYESKRLLRGSILRTNVCINKPM